MDSLPVTALDPATGHGLVRVTDEMHRVPFSAPGDTVTLKDGAPDAVEPLSPHRTAPRCPHFGECGGCQLQHLDDGFIAEWKRDLVRDTLLSHGIEAQIGPTQTIPLDSRRRAKFTLERTKKTTRFGFRAQGEHRVIDLTTCPILTPSLDAARDVLRAVAALGAPRKRPVTLSATATDSGFDVAVEDAKDLDLPMREALAPLAEAANIARLVWNGEVVILRYPPSLRFGDAIINPPPHAFLQAAQQTETLINTILRETLEKSQGKVSSIADLFCGCGTFTLPMAKIAPVTAVDGDAAMVASLDEAARKAQGLQHIDTLTRDLFRRPLLPQELNRFAAVIFDPPRAGAKAQSAESAKSDVPLVIGISCNHGTFARDAATLIEGGYTLDHVIPVDQFLFSPHVEVIGTFRKTR